jgi:transcriptional regulator with XRE-family HTH domain
MARPRGYRLNRAALTDVLALRTISLTEAAQRCGMPLTTLSSLSHGDHRASMRTIRTLADGLGVAPETLFPELAFPEMRAS